MSSLRDVQRLRTLTLVLDLGSISAAASVLGYTQSATSQQLRALEREVGMPLVDRSQRPLRATPAGALLRVHVERVLAALESTEALLQDLRAGVLRLRVAAFGNRTRSPSWTPSPSTRPGARSDGRMLLTRPSYEPRRRRALASTAGPTRNAKGGGWAAGGPAG